MPTWLGRRSAPQLFEKALELLDNGKFERALKTAGRLRELRFSGAFEIEALAYRGMGQLEKAASALEQGVKATPSLWSLHNLLGNTYSDLGLYDKAMAAFTAGEACEGADSDVLRFNQSLVLDRQGLHAQALEICPLHPHSPDLRTHCTHHRLDLLNKLDRHNEVLELTAAILESMDAETHYQRGRALWALSHRADALEQAVLSLRADFSLSPRAQRLLEEIADPASLLCRRYFLRVQGKLDKRKHKAAGFFVVCQVVAEDLETAQAIYRADESPELADQLSVIESEDLGPFPVEYRGVFHKLGRAFY